MTGRGLCKAPLSDTDEIVAGRRLSDLPNILLTAPSLTRRSRGLSVRGLAAKHFPATGLLPLSRLVCYSTRCLRFKCMTPLIRLVLRRSRSERMVKQDRKSVDQYSGTTSHSGPAIVIAVHSARKKRFWQHVSHAQVTLPLAKARVCQPFRCVVNAH